MIHLFSLIDLVPSSRTNAKEFNTSFIISILFTRKIEKRNVIFTFRTFTFLVIWKSNYIMEFCPKHRESDQQHLAEAYLKPFQQVETTLIRYELKTT